MCFAHRLNNSINFFLYCMGGNRFRRELAAMCRCCGRGARQVHPDISQTGTTAITGGGTLTNEPPSDGKSPEKSARLVTKTTHDAGDKIPDTNEQAPEKIKGTAKIESLCCCCCYSASVATSYTETSSSDGGKDTARREMVKLRRLHSRRSSAVIETLSRIQEEEQDQDVEAPTSTGEGAAGNSDVSQKITIHPREQEEIASEEREAVHSRDVHEQKRGVSMVTCEGHKDNDI